MKRTLQIICITCIALLITFGCAVNTNDEDDPLLKMDENPFVGRGSDESYNFELALVQTPSEITSYDAVYIDFDSIEVSQEDVDGGWIIVNEDGGIVDLLHLAGGGSHTLALTELEPGQYNQVRFNVNRVWMIVNGSEIEVEIPSKTLDFLKQFSIVEGDVTEIVAEIDFYQSFLQYEQYDPLCGFGRYRRCFRRLVIRLLYWYEVGMIKGRVVYPKFADITVTAYKDDSTDVYKKIRAFYFGYFYLTCMEPDTYDIVIESDGYEPYIVDDVIVEAGDIVNLGFISLTEIKMAHTITVDVTYTDDSLNDFTVYVTSYTAGGNIENDEFETVSATISGSTATVVLDNNGNGYQDGGYDIRAHIDKSNNGLNPVQDDDFVAFGSVTVSGSSPQVSIIGPWGSYFYFQVNVFAPVSPDTTDKTLYLAVVESGGTWDTYRFGGDTFTPPLGLKPQGARIPNCWGVAGTYDVIAVIDMDGDGDLSSGDLTAGVQGIVITGPGDNIDPTPPEILAGVWTTY